MVVRGTWWWFVLVLVVVVIVVSSGLEGILATDGTTALQ